ncbi:MAG TPA: hypothetical protein VFP50_01815 [Anaeromyxobacteraceae bacterium]|nr:hypothetical protein [Anaeromyxobacteraceae bacterium]
MAVIALSLPLATFAEEAAKPAEPPKPTITPYGFVLVNSFWNSGTFATKDYPGQVSTVQDGGAFMMTARQSRFGVKLAMNDDNWTGAALTGVVEFDFKGGHIAGNPTCTQAAPVPPATIGTITCTQGATASSGFYNGLMRLRLANATATWKTSYGTWALLGGQDYGLVNPLFATSVAWVADPLFWQAGNLWRRSPQFRLTYGNQFDAVGVNVQLAMLSPADGSTPVDFGAGNRSRRPDLEGRLALSYKYDTYVSTVGAGYHFNKRRYANAASVTAGPTVTQDLTEKLFGVDADLNVPYLEVKGEYYNGTASDDTYFGIIANAVTGTLPNFVAVRSTGYWAQAIVKPIDRVWLTFGVGQAKLTEGDLPAAAAIAAGTQRSKNQQVAGGIIVNAGKYWKFALEAEQTKTTYHTTSTPNDRDAIQVGLSSQLTF